MLKGLVASVGIFLASIFGGGAPAAPVSPSLNQPASAIVALSETSNLPDPATSSATTTIINQHITQPVVERVIATGGGGVSESELDTKMNQLENKLTSMFYNWTGAQGGIPASPVVNSIGAGGVWNTIAGTNKIDQLTNTTLNNVTVNGISGLTTSNIPDLSGSYLSLSGGTIAGNLTASMLSGRGAGLYGVPILSTSEVHTFGDSITAGNGASPSSNAYAPLIAADMGATLTNRAISGSQACDMADLQIFANENPTTPRSPVYTMLIGTNDANIKGAGAYESVFNLCQQASITWLTIPTRSKVFGQSSLATKSGTWVNDDYFQTGIGLQSTTNGSTLALPITTTGGPIYVWYRIIDGNGGTFSYSLDGGAQTTVNAFTSPAIAAHNGDTRSVALIRIPNVAAGSHSVTFTVNSATNASNIVSILGVGTPESLVEYNPPSLYVGGVIRQTSDAKASDTSAYNADIQSNVNLLAGDGLLVHFVDVRSYVNDATDMNDTVHPNNSGHSHIRDAFDGMMQFVPVTSSTGIFSGNVGVGTTTTNVRLNVSSGTSGYTWTPNSRDVAVFDSSNSAGTALVITGPSTGSDAIFFGKPTNETTGQVSYNNATANLELTATGGHQLVLASGGNAGLGGTTTPYALLSLSGTNGGTKALFSISTSTSAFATTTSLTVDANGNLSLYNGASLTAPLLGVGSIAPTYLLDVRGNGSTGQSVFHQGYNNSDNGLYSLVDSSARSWIGANVVLNSSSQWIAKSTSATLMGQPGGYFTWYANTGLVAGNSFTPTERMRLDPSGNLGIGDSAPGTKLSVVGNAQIGYASGQTSPANGLIVLGNVGIGTTSPYALLSISNSASTAANTPLFVIASTTAGTATTTVLSVASTGNVTITGSAATCTLGNGSSATNCSSSDQRLKDNITSLDASSSLAAIRQLNPVSFIWNAWMVGNGSPTTTQFGFIAQQVSPVFGNLVSEDPNTHYYKLDYQGLFAPIVGAIQALANEIGGFADSFTTKELTFTRASGDEIDVRLAKAQTLCLGSTCVTESQLQALLANASSAGNAPASDSATDAPDTEPPVITISGNNPAHVAVGTSYSDLGAQVTDNVDKNLGIKTFLNGALTSNIVIDTSAAATDTIDYVATDNAGNAATSTRTVIVESGADPAATASALDTASTTTQ